MNDDLRRRKEMENERNFDLLTLGQLLLRLSPPNNERLSRGDTFVKQVGGAELNVAVGVALLVTSSMSGISGIAAHASRTGKLTKAQQST